MKAATFEGAVRLDHLNGVGFTGDYTVEGLDAAVRSLFPEDSLSVQREPRRRVRVTIEVVEE